MGGTEAMQVDTGRGDGLWCRLDTPSEPGPRPTVVVGHGFKGFMDWGFFPYLAELLASRGFTVVRFNTRGSGMRPGDEKVTDLEAFAGATIRRDVEDWHDVLAAVLDGRLGEGRVDAERVGLLGHSRGGGTALLTAASDAGLAGVRALVTWNAVGTFARFADEEKALWREQGWAPVVNARTGQELRVDLAVLEEIETEADRLDLERAAVRRRAPWLLVHGSSDETVPVAEAHLLAAAATEPVELRIVEGGAHTFGAQHPFVGPTPHLTEAMNATQTWFRRHL